MSLPMMENPSGEYCFVNGNKVKLVSDEARDLLRPVADTIFYESIRVSEGVLLFFENHMLRLLQSIEAASDFPVDTDSLYDDAMRLIRESDPPVDHGNIRIVVTDKLRLVHLTSVTYPSQELFHQGVVTSQLPWERREPNVKIFRDDYKTAIGKALTCPTKMGMPYEILLANRSGQIIEGGRSNFFVYYHNVIYSAPDDAILIGVTRRYVLQAIKQAGYSWQIGSYTLSELMEMKSEKDPERTVAVFLTSSPFDILPIRAIDDVMFDSANHEALRRISEQYQSIVSHYISIRKTSAEPLE